MEAVYYQDDHVTIYHGDCREILPGMDYRSIYTDPVWPNNSIEEFSGIDPEQLLGECLEVTACKHLVIHLGSDSDPRMLSAVPTNAYPFLRVCWLRYARPSYKGRHLNGSEVAYVFGQPVPASKFPGRRHLLPGESPTDGEVTMTNNEKRFQGHPCPRRLSHVKWLLNCFTDGTILDPFSGVGTTLLAAKEMGLKAIGIEIEEKYCEAAANRLSQGCFLTDT